MMGWFWRLIDRRFQLDRRAAHIWAAVPQTPTPPNYTAAMDIPDAVFLAAVIAAAGRRGAEAAMPWDVAAVLGDRPVPRDFDADADIRGVPDRVILAKADDLIVGGLLDGRAYRSRGHLEVTDAGLQLMHEFEAGLHRH